jgi:hypothetical protein
MGGHPFPEVPCTIWGRPVDGTVGLSADENGKAVHEGCYVSRLTSRESLPSNTFLIDFRPDVRPSLPPARVSAVAGRRCLFGRSKKRGGYRCVRMNLILPRSSVFRTWSPSLVC